MPSLAKDGIILSQLGVVHVPAADGLASSGGGARFPRGVGALTTVSDSCLPSPWSMRAAGATVLGEVEL